MESSAADVLPSEQDQHELIPIVLGFERLGELLSHLHPQKLQEATEASQEAYFGEGSGSRAHPVPLGPWHSKDGCEDPEGLVSKYVEQSVVWAAMIVSRCRATFVEAHLKQKKAGALGLLKSLQRARQRRLAGALGLWRQFSYLLRAAAARLKDLTETHDVLDCNEHLTEAQKKQLQLQLWSQGVAQTLRLKLQYAQLLGITSVVFLQQLGLAGFGRSSCCI